MGVSPKLFSRLIRFRGAFEALRTGARQSEVALAAGYADQAHLLREFCAFAGTAPGTCFRRWSEVSDSFNRPS